MSRARHRRVVARMRLREAHVPRSALRPEDLATFPSYQWATLIHLARRVQLARLAEAARNPVQRFVEAYRKERDAWPR